MKRCIIILCGFLLLPTQFYAIDKIFFKNGFNLEPKMAENEIFLKECSDVEILPAEKEVYFLDKTYGMIFKVDLNTGKLLKTISSKGQAPQELHIPISLRIRNGRIFVLDKGFMGIKIFDLDGKFIDCFKIGSILFGNRNIYVNEKNEIFVGKIDLQANTMVTVYDLKGKELRSLIPFLKRGEKDNTQETLERKTYLLNLDSKGNIYILYYVLRDLAKFDKNGNQLWKVHIENEILGSSRDNDYVKTDGKTLNMRWSIYNIDITNEDEIVIGHAGGGSIFDVDGRLKKLIFVNEDIEEYKNTALDLNIFRIRENVLISASIAGIYINIYKYKENVK